MRLLLSILVTVVLHLSSHAQLKRLDAVIDERGRTATITYYLFQPSRSKITVETTSDPNKSFLNLQALAGISGQSQLQTTAPRRNLVQKSGSLAFQANSSGSTLLSNLHMLILNGKPQIKSLSRQERHTLIGLSNNGEWFLAYTPPASSDQLAKALSSSALAPKDVAIVNRGNTALIWAKNQQYHPYYLKPLSPPNSILAITK